MGCRRAASTLLMLLLAISLLTLDRPAAHARHVKDTSMATGEHSSTKKGLQGMRKVGVKNANETGTVEVKESTGKGAQKSVRHGASPEFAEVVVQRYGPRPHPKKHN